MRRGALGRQRQRQHQSGRHTQAPPGTEGGPGTSVRCISRNTYCPRRGDAHAGQPHGTCTHGAADGRGVLKGRDFFFFFLLRTALKDRPKGPPTANRQLPSTANRHRPPTTNRHQPPATNRRQPPAATNRQLPTTANRLQPPTASHQPPPTTTNRHQPPVANCQPPTAANRQPPTATNHG